MSNTAPAQTFTDTQGAPPEGMTSANAPPPELDAPFPGTGADSAPPEIDSPPPKPAAKEEDSFSPGKLATQLRARERRLKTERQEFESKRLALAADQQAYGRLVETATTVADLANRDPVQLLRNLGWTDQAIAERLLHNGQPGPHERTARMEQEIASLRQERATERQERERQEKAAAVERETTKFVAEAQASKDKRPLAAKWSAARLVARGMEIVNEQKGKGPPLSNEEILDKIEAELSEIAALAGNARGAKKQERDALTSTPEELAADLTAELQRVRGAPEEDDGDGVDILMLSEDEQLEHTLRAIERAKKAGPRHERRADGTRRRV